MHTSAGEDSEVHAIATEIERYLACHPRSKDSTEGIRSWWLTGSTQVAASFKIDLALERLVTRGVVVKEILPDGRVIYSSARRPLPP